MKYTGVAMGGVLALSQSLHAAAMEGTAGDFEALIPADKNLSDSWIRSLYERGKPEWFSGAELKYIGMPVGGICCGQVYLSGDGRLWHWDIFNQGIRTATNGPHYRKPMQPDAKLDLGFSVHARVGNQDVTRALDVTGFPDVRFRGAYPMGLVEYTDKNFPVAVSLEAFSPFTPLDVDGSSLPLTVMRYTVRNASAQAADVSVAGALTNPILRHSGNDGAELVNTVKRLPGATCVHYTADTNAPDEPSLELRKDIVFEDFESGTYDNWTVKGTAFGAAPIAAADLPAYQGNAGPQGKYLVNSHNTRQGEDVAAGDAHVGSLTSKPFSIERRYLKALIGGGSNADSTALQLLIGNKVVARLTGHNNNQLRRKSVLIGEYEGREARLRIIDNSSGGWGNIGVDDIVFSDTPASPLETLEKQPDMGDMTLAILDEGDSVFASPNDSATEHTGVRHADTARARGRLGKTVRLAPGESATITFAVAWRFPNQKLKVGSDTGHYYAERFASSIDAVAQLGGTDEAYARTRLWHDAWYDSTLPYWLLDRTFVNTSILASTTCFRFAGGRFYGWEGVGCCAGTCQHVWHYAQSVGRVFPELERITRERVDYGLSFQPDGSLWYRGEAGKHAAIDGQCGTILRVYREHTMSADDAFLRRIWPRVKHSIEFMIRQDGDGNGVLEGKQMNTLDSAWYGPIAWISSLYIAALRAGAAMGSEMGDDAFSATCTAIADRGGKRVTETLFNGEYYFQLRDSAHPGAIGAGIGCDIDQVLGQWWAHQLGLGRALPREETVTALKSLWRYNFAPDVGPYRVKYRSGRWYAVAGEAGLIMCTFPKGGMSEAGGGKVGKGFAGYFNECMTGFEYQAAAHMISEGLVQEGLAVARAIHDRYHASRRNPYNEIECGDHYARAMASHGVFISICGFEHHGPRGYIGFDPKLAPEDFRAPFIASEGWGTFSQKRNGRQQVSSLHLTYGKLRLAQMAFALPAGVTPKTVSVEVNGKSVASGFAREGVRFIVSLPKIIAMKAGQVIKVEQKWS